MHICLTSTTESSSILVGGSRKIVVQGRHRVHEVLTLVSIGNVLIRRCSFQRANTMDIITPFHVGDKHILGEFIPSIILFVEDQGLIDLKPLIITSILINCQIPLDWNRLALIGLVLKMNRMELEM